MDEERFGVSLVVHRVGVGSLQGIVGSLDDVTAAVRAGPRDRCGVGVLSRSCRTPGTRVARESRWVTSSFGTSRLMQSLMPSSPSMALEGFGLTDSARKAVEQARFWASGCRSGPPRTGSRARPRPVRRPPDRATSGRGRAGLDRGAQDVTGRDVRRSVASDRAVRSGYPCRRPVSPGRQV